MPVCMKKSRQGSCESIIIEKIRLNGLSTKPSEYLASNSLTLRSGLLSHITFAVSTDNIQ
jgi:hypothetical protein